VAEWLWRVTQEFLLLPILYRRILIVKAVSNPSHNPLSRKILTNHRRGFESHRCHHLFAISLALFGIFLTFFCSLPFHPNIVIIFCYLYCHLFGIFLASFCPFVVIIIFALIIFFGLLPSRFAIVLVNKLSTGRRHKFEEKPKPV
jgi:hypothetical protein